MPLASKAQRRYLWATDPKTARKFEEETPKGKKLPEKKKKEKGLHERKEKKPPKGRKK